MQLLSAHKQWADRPADERFSDLESMQAACLAYRRTAQEKEIAAGELRVDVRPVEINGETEKDLVVTRGVNTARVSNWAFGQLCNRVGAPRGYLEKLPATLVAQNINHGLANLGGEEKRAKVNCLFHNGNGLLLRSLTSEKYSRIWNYEVCDRLLQLGDTWTTPPAFSRGKFGGELARGDAGLYASDHDMFAFLVDETRRVDDGSGEGLSRGFFCWNSEVGARSFGVMTFLYRYVCGNHIVWGAENVVEVRVRHVGDAARRRAFGQMAVKLRRYASSSPNELEGKIAEARRVEIAGTKDDVLDAIFQKRIASRKQAERAYELAEKHSDTDGSPRSRWGIVQGLTRLAGEEIHADKRHALDVAAGKVMEADF